MKRAALALAVALGIAAIPVSSNGHESSGVQERRNNCILCCMASKENVMDVPEIHYDQCLEVCDWLIRRWFE